MLSKQDVATYRRDGVIVIPDVLDTATVANLRRVVAEVVAGAANVTQHDDVYDLEPSHTSAMPRVVPGRARRSTSDRHGHCPWNLRSGWRLRTRREPPRWAGRWRADPGRQASAGTGSL